MTATDTLDVATLSSGPTQTYRERQIAYWREEARRNWTDGFMDLARRCETFASDWDWSTTPCGR